jgi:hypothetical protein
MIDKRNLKETVYVTTLYSKLSLINVMDVLIILIGRERLSVYLLFL